MELGLCSAVRMNQAHAMCTAQTGRDIKRVKAAKSGLLKEKKMTESDNREPMKIILRCQYSSWETELR